jgi:sulfite exporter TauE/SafE
MTSPALLLSALMMGLLGSTHCIVMCGGVVAMACSALPIARRAGPVAQLPYVLAYNAGRIASYGIAGAAAGALGASLASFGSVQHAQLSLRLAAGAMTVAVGLYVAGVARALSWVERLGEPVWRRLAPLARTLVPVQTPAHALALGLLWGWMPCGLVYAALAVAVSSGSPGNGAATMTAFGLGTLPMLVTMGSAAVLVARLARNRRVRMIAGVAMVAMGTLQLVHVSDLWTETGRGVTAACCSVHRYR